ncbi:hypothetical protein V6Z11_A07G116300 [Gossypium hirsutum]
MISIFFSNRRSSVFDPFSLNFRDPFKDFPFPSSLTTRTSNSFAFVNARIYEAPTRGKSPRTSVVLVFDTDTPPNCQIRTGHTSSHVKKGILLDFLLSKLETEKNPYTRIEL